ncbi:MAG: hypothetical protein ACHQ9S_23490 [Candidatus Binatia bacterium]
MGTLVRILEALLVPADANGMQDTTTNTMHRPLARPLGIEDRKLRIQNEVLMVAPRFAERGGVDFDEANGDWLRIQQFALPDRWQHRWAQLLIVFPQTYPVSPPLGFYLDRKFSLAVGGGDPHLTGSAYHGAPDLLAQGWYWYCVQPLAAAQGGWRPSADYRTPDNLWSFLALVRDVLSNDQ